MRPATARTSSTAPSAALNACILVVWLGTTLAATVDIFRRPHVPPLIRVCSVSSLFIGFVFFPMAIKTCLSASLLTFLDLSCLQRNGKYLSAVSETHVRPSADVERGHDLPPIIVHLPVFTESLEGTIMPTLHSLHAAVEAYRREGGSARILVMDDGMALLGKHDAAARAAAYHSIGATYTARPAHARAGLFKKASNMNHALAVDVPPSDSIILLVDSDTRVPVHCIALTVREFNSDPSVSFVQHATVPFLHQEDPEHSTLFERFICRFTRRIYWSGILLGVTLGDSAPLVGHNVFLRWSAVAAAKPAGSGRYWAEDTVSEDFDMSLRLVAAGGVGRYATYCGDGREGFQEGVSLTLADEVKKWRKYTFGVCELLLSRRRLWAYASAVSVPWHHKMSLALYATSYLAMGLAVPYAILEGTMSLAAPVYFAQSTGSLHALDVTLACTVVFAGFGTLGEVLLRVRKQKMGPVDAMKTLVAEVAYIPVFALFFGGLTIHVASATVACVLGLPQTWGSTNKDRDAEADVRVERGTATKRRRRSRKVEEHTLVVFWQEYACVALFGAIYVSFAVFLQGRVDVYEGWGVVSLVGCHLLGPLLLEV